MSEPMVYAGFWRRLNAYGVDSLIVLLITWGINLTIGDAFAQASPADIQALVEAGLLPAGTTQENLLAQAFSGSGTGSLISWGDLILPTLVSAAYNILFLIGDWQATPGKHWFKTKVVKTDGSKLTPWDSCCRHLLSGVSMWVLCLGYVPIFFTKQKTAWHDIVCNTRVIMR